VADTSRVFKTQEVSATTSSRKTKTPAHDLSRAGVPKN